MAPELLTLALDFYRSPLRYPQLTTPQLALPDGFGRMLEELATAVSPQNLENLSKQLWEKPETIEAATLFFLQQVLMMPGADHYRVLGLPRGAPESSIRQHYQLLLMGFFHPDRPTSETSLDASLIARIEDAYSTLRYQASREQYLEQLSLSSSETPLKPDIRFFCSPAPPAAFDTDKEDIEHPADTSQKKSIVIWAMAVVASIAIAVPLLINVLSKPQPHSNPDTAAVDAPAPKPHEPQTLESDPTTRGTAQPPTSGYASPAQPTSAPLVSEPPPEEDKRPTAETAASPNPPLRDLGAQELVEAPKPDIAPQIDSAPQIEPAASAHSDTAPSASAGSEIKATEPAQPSEKPVGATSVARGIGGYAPKAAPTDVRRGDHAAEAAPTDVGRGEPAAEAASTDTDVQTASNAKAPETTRQQPMESTPPQPTETAQEETPDKPKAPEETQKNISASEATAIVRRYVRAYNRGDIPTMIQMITPDFRFNEGSGTAAMQRLYGEFFTRVPNRKLEFLHASWKMPTAETAIGRISVLLDLEEPGQASWQRFRGNMRFELVRAGKRVKIKKVIHTLW